MLLMMMLLLLLLMMMVMLLMLMLMVLMLVWVLLEQLKVVGNLLRVGKRVMARLRLGLLLKLKRGRKRGVNWMERMDRVKGKRYGHDTH